MSLPTNPSYELSDRDRRVIALVTRFKQLTARHITYLLFNDVLSKTPVDRTLKRLADRGYLLRTERRIVGGARGGSGQYVYSLGRRGFFLTQAGRFAPMRTVNFHTLAIADAFIELKRLEQAGELVIIGVSTEPDCWVRVGGVELKPDMHVELAQPSVEPLKLWLEIDMGTESQRQIREKLERYWRAYNEADVTTWPVFPSVVFLAVDEERERELKWLVGQGPKEAQKIFQVCTLAHFASLF